MNTLHGGKQFIGSAGLVGFLYFIVLIVDSTALTKANKYCSSGMPNASFLPSLEERPGDFGIECFSGSFTGTVMSDVLAFLCFPALAGYFFFYLRQQNRKDKPSASGSERQPLTQPEEPKKVYTASELKDETLVCG